MIKDDKVSQRITRPGFDAVETEIKVASSSAQWH
jgi:hypothetical protein